MLRKILLMAAGVGLTITANPQNASAQAIYACTTTTGTLYVVSAGTTCPGGRPLLTWSVTGPQGPPGPTGATGATGATGPAGAPGGLSKATFQGGSNVGIPMGSTFVKIISKTLPAGSWSVWAIANTSIEGTSDEVTVNTLSCELRLDNNFIGGATDRRIVPEGSTDGAFPSLSMFGGAQALAGGSEISLWCNSQHTAIVDDALIMAITLGGFQ